MPKKVFVSGCYDLLHSGHVEFFRQAAEYGDLYVEIGSDATILEYKHHKTVYSEHARRYLADTGLPKERTYVTGSPMAEVLHNNLKEIEASDIHQRLAA